MIVCSVQTYYRYSGDSWEEKPRNNIQNASIFWEKDTGKEYEWREDDWYLKILQPITAIVSNLPDAAEKYNRSDTDTEKDPAYYGYLASSGAFFIVEFNVHDRTTRYFWGSSDYQKAWEDRTHKKYEYFNVVSPDSLDIGLANFPINTPVTVSNFPTFPTEIEISNFPETGEEAQIVYEDADTLYICKAEIGSVSTDPVWKIKKVEGMDITWCDGDSLYDNVATSLLIVKNLDYA